MDNRFSFLPPTPLALLLAPTMALAQGIFLPSEKDISQAAEKAREAMTKVQPSPATVKPSVPHVGALPKTNATAPDIASIAEKYKDLGRAMAQEQQREAARVELLVLVSMSMPREALERILGQAEKAGATLVFRGLKEDSMLKMTEEIKAIIGNRNVNVAIHPPAFQQFSVTRVPAVVLAKGEASNVMENGCAKADTFVKVTGDVSIDHALDYIERHGSETWAREAKKFRSRIVQGL